jgi:hypothetical protein
MIVTIAADSRSEITPRQDLITTQKYQFAALAMANRNALRKSRSTLCVQSLPQCRQLPSGTTILQIDVENLCCLRG